MRPARLEYRLRPPPRLITTRRSSTAEIDDHPVGRGWLDAKNATAGLPTAEFQCLRTHRTPRSDRRNRCAADPSRCRPSISRAHPRRVPVDLPPHRGRCPQGQTSRGRHHHLSGFGVNDLAVRTRDLAEDPGWLRGVIGPQLGRQKRTCGRRSEGSASSGRRASSARARETSVVRRTPRGSARETTRWSAEPRTASCRVPVRVSSAPSWLGASLLSRSPRRPVYRDSTGTKETSKCESRRITPTLSA